jgi:hypothetical protein
MDVRLIELRRSAGSDGADRRSFGDDGASEHAGRSQMDEGDGIAVSGADRHGLAAAGH